MWDIDLWRGNSLLSLGRDHVGVGGSLISIRDELWSGTMRWGGDIRAIDGLACPSSHLGPGCICGNPTECFGPLTLLESGALTQKARISAVYQAWYSPPMLLAVARMGAAEQRLLGLAGRHRRGDGVVLPSRARTSGAHKA